MFSKIKQWVLIAGIAGVLTLGWALATDSSQGYSSYQAEFRKLVAEKLGPEKATQAPRGVQQIWIKDADKTDRCVTCHQGVTWAGLEDAPEPFRTHPKEPLAKHPVEKFGCTYCHGGQGPATRLPDAHGWVKHWEDPLLDSSLAKDYQANEPFAFMQIKCNTCHRFDKQTAGAEYINNAKTIVNQKGCRACHTINSRGGSIGPDLTSVGDKQAEQYDYSRLTEFASVFNWEVGHLQNPKSFTPDTVMPDFGLSSRDAQSIAMLLASWKELDIPASLLPDGPRKDVPSPEEAEQERVMREGEGKFFVEKTCFICHDVSSLGIHSATKIGPDLALAEEDAPRRFGVPLEVFLHNPSGTMSVVLTRQIHLTDAEVDEAISLLKKAHQKYLQQQAAKEQAKPAPTAPASGQASPTK